MKAAKKSVSCFKMSLTRAAAFAAFALILPGVSSHNPVTCLPDWIPKGGSDQCYNFLRSADMRKSFEAARTYCESFGGRLAFGKSRADLEWIAARLNGVDQSYWIGLNLDVDQIWRWLDRTPLNPDETPWEDGFPQDGQNCGAVTLMGKLMSVNCPIEEGFVCERGLGAPVFCDTANGWEIVEDACFKVFRDAQEWEGARRTCISESSSLLEVMSEVESSVASDIVRFKLDNDAWIGLHERGGEYQWEQDGDHAEFNWASDSTPPTMNGHGAAYIMHDGGRWDAALELEKKYFICRRNKGGCVPGWEEWEGMCYHFDFDEAAQLAYVENKDFCQGMGSQMLRITSSVSQTFVDHRLSAFNKDIGLWLGLKEITIDSHAEYHWENDELYDVTTQFNEILDISILSDFSFAVKYGREGNIDETEWLRTDPLSPQFGACQAQVGQELTIAVSHDEYHCPEGWMMPWSGTCYLFVSEEMNWFDARQLCAKNASGGDLVSVGSLIEQSHVYGMIFESQTNIWIGYNDRESEDHWAWSDGSPVKYTNHDPEWNAESQTRYNCAMMRGADSFWVQWNCASYMQFICEVPASIGPTPTIAPPVTDVWSAACGPGWKEDPSTGRCYMIQYTSLIFFNAEYECNAKGANLLSINTPEEQNFIDGFVTGQNLQGYVFWIGGFEPDEGGWRWNDGSPFAFINWNDGEPNNWGEEDCMAMLFSTGVVGKWNDDVCEDRFYSICEKPGANYVTPAPPPSIDTSCPDGWTVFEGNCYYFPSDKRKWEDARSACKGVNPAADLPIVTSRQENEFIIGHFEGSSFIGLHVAEGTSGFWWIDGQGLTGYENWADGEPNSGGSEDCVEIMFMKDPGKHGRWNDIPCGNENHYACEYEPRVCPTGFNYHHGACYQFVKEDATQADAEAKCQSLHLDAHLPSIHSAEENAYLHEHREATTWLGFVRGEDWSWLDKSAVDFMNWEEGEPNNAGTGEGCAEMVPDSAEWNDVPCDFVRRVTCKYQPSHIMGCPVGWEDSGKLCYAIISERKQWEAAESDCRIRGGYLASINEISEQEYLGSLVVDPEDKPCPDGWIRYESRCYFKSQEQAMFDEARQYCVNAELESSDLVWIFEPHENDFIKTILDQDKEYWIGLENRNPEKKYLWTVDGSEAKFTSWQFGYPQGDDQCSYFPGPPSPQWMTDSCVGPVRNYICSGFIRKETMNYWIGFNDRTSENYFQWVDGSETLYTAWNDRMPSKSSGDPRHCVYMAGSDALWAHDRCDADFAYICSKRRTIEPIPEPDEGCDPGQIGFGSSCYTIQSEKQTWYVADGRCETRKGYLAALNSAEESGRISAWLTTHDKDAFWIGLTDAEELRSSGNRGPKEELQQFGWSDGEQVEYTNWGTGQPNPDFGGCAFVSSKTENLGLWYVAKCEEARFQSICETPRKVYTDPPQPTTPMVSIDCPHGWKKYDTHCYRYFHQPPQERLTWAAARDFCKQFGEAADLVSFQSRQEEHTLFSPSDPDTDKIETLWIGLNDLGGNGWEWSDGAPVAYLHWQIGEPPSTNETVAQTAHCAAFDIDYKPNGIDHSWRTHSCDAVRDHACEMPAGTTPGITLTLPTVPQPQSCGGQLSEWFEYNGNCYLIVSGQEESDRALDWHMARVSCIEKGGELASVHSQVENTVILSQVNKYGDHRFYIGLTRYGLTGAEDEFKWSDGSPVDFVFWNRNEPNNFDDQESCVTIYNGGLDGYWNDDNCGSKLGYVCKTCKENCDPRVTTLPPPPGGCPSGWRQFGGSCYSVYTEENGTDFARARSLCKGYADPGHHSELASIHGIREKAFVHTMLHFANDQTWIGLTDKINNNFVYMWTDQTSVNFVDWGFAQPIETDSSSGQQLDCVRAQKRDGRWSTADCTAVDASFICKMPVKTNTVSDPVPRCQGTYSDFEEFDSDCYLMVTDLQTWQKAEDFCVSKGAHLASVRSTVENNLLLSRSEGTRRYWIGLRYSKEKRRYEWSDGRSVEHTEWGPNSPPLNPNDAPCGALNPENGEWSSEDCNQMKFPFFCKYSNKPEPTITSIGECPDYSWMLYGDMCYKTFFEDPMLFSAANMRCQNLGGHLVSVHSLEENQFLQSLALNGTSRDIWLGLTRTSDASWTWTDGSAVEFDLWQNHEPNGLDGETCVEMYKNVGTWNDINCESPRDFICKAPSSYTTNWPIPTDGGNEGKGGANSGGIAAGVVIAIVAAIAVVGAFSFMAYRRPTMFQTMRIRALSLCGICGEGDDSGYSRDRDTVAIDTDDVIS